MNTHQKKVAKYIATEVLRYFSDLHNIEVAFRGEKTIIKLIYPGDGKPATYVCEPGSDDSWFTFQDKDNCLPGFTIPLMKEE